jgi:hypothetical protein
MRAPSIVSSICGALFVAGVAQAENGSCNKEIMDVTKKLVASEIGSASTTLYSPLVASTHRHSGAASIGSGAHDQVFAQDVERRARAKSDASQALELAHSFDVQGKEAECMNEVMNARQLAGL